MGTHHTPYPPEFRAQMVELVKAGRAPEELAREFELRYRHRARET
jgi:transposase